MTGVSGLVYGSTFGPTSSLVYGAKDDVSMPRQYLLGRFPFSGEDGELPSEDYELPSESSWLGSVTLPSSYFEIMGVGPFFTDSGVPINVPQVLVEEWITENGQPPHWYVFRHYLYIYDIDEVSSQVITKAAKVAKATDDLTDALLWGVGYDGGLASFRGADPIFNSAGVTPAGDGTTYAQNVLPVDKLGRGVWNGPGFTNLLGSAPTAPLAVTLTAQKYCLQCFDTGSVSCSYGTATPGTPLIFTATAGSITFTPTSCGGWELTASGGYVFPRIIHGATVTSCAGSATNGLRWLMDSKVLGALSGVKCTVAALVYMGVGTDELAGFASSLSEKNNSLGCLYTSNSGSGLKRTVRSYDGATAISPSETDWLRYEIHLKFSQVNLAGTHFRSGSKRYTSSGVAIDSAPKYSSWATYDGSFNPLIYLIAGYGLTVPQWITSAQVWKQPEVDFNVLEKWAWRLAA